MTIKFNYHEAFLLADLFGGDEETTITVMQSETGHSGPGLYATVDGAEDEGAVFLSYRDDEEDHGDHPDRPDFMPEAQPNEQETK